MANSVYPKAKEAFGNAGINWGSDTIKTALAKTAGYTSTHQYLSDYTGAGGVLSAQTGTLANKSDTNGVFTATTTTISAVAPGNTWTCLLVYKDTTVATTSNLIVFIDTDSGGKLPFTSNGGDLQITWDPTNGIFKF